MVIKQLLENAELWLKEHGYAEKTIYSNYVRFWNAFVKSTDESNEFSESLIVTYLIDKCGRNILNENHSYLPSEEYRAHRAFRSIIEFYTTATISGTSMVGASIRQILPESENLILEKYMDHVTNLDYTLKTKSVTYGIVHHYLRFCPLSTINHDQVIEYFDNFEGLSKITIQSKLAVLKRFHKYCFNQGFLNTDFGTLFPSSRRWKDLEIPSVYTSEEISLLLNYLKNNGENRKRNYAIGLLGAVYGFRSGDIVKMKLSDIDWDKGLINIIQSKTKKPIEHCLIPQTGNALTEYILEERPDSRKLNIFLKQNADELKPISVSTIIRTAFIHSNIVINGRKQGAHSLRHSLAFNMLASNAGILEVSKALGHVSTNSTKVYTKVDIPNLRLCELEVSTNGK